MLSTLYLGVRDASSAFLLTALCFGAGLASAQAPPIFVPQNDSVVLARVPRGYAAWRETETRFDSPEGLALAMAQVAREGDARLAGRLQKHLDGLPSKSGSHVTLARAWIAQHQHRFANARGLLDELLAREPRDASALAMRAHINLTQGRLRDAQRDCAALLFIEARQAMFCGARLAERRGNFEGASRLLARLRTGEDAVARDALLLSAEIAAARRDPSAEDFFRTVRELAPDDVRPRIAYARWLRRVGRSREALQLLPIDPAHDGLALERVLSAAASKLPDAQAQRTRLLARYAAARAAGVTPETRDEAELALLAGDSQRGLQLALANFQTQRDMEDFELLERAARAARQPQSLAPLEAWASREGVVRLRPD